ncbi:MAG: stage 0 sporulation protein [Anaerolineales bacterium]|nr:MAG: stage 0 sporulation protein [Anaerolineales bacterium]
MAESPERESSPQPTSSESLVAGVRFHATGKVYHFDATGQAELRDGDFVLVETARGLQLGEVLVVRAARDGEKVSELKPVRRRATGRDLALRQRWLDKGEEALQGARDIVKDLGLPLKIAAADYTYDGSRLTILYVSEAEPDLDKLRQRLRRRVGGRVTLRRVGPRDHARLLCGYGACGEQRCCSRFLSEFRSVSMRMAKTQGVSLNPTEITGMCGRLRCCLVFEHELYAEASKSMPKLKKRVRTPHGEGKVVGRLPLKGVVVVQIDDRRVEVPAKDVERIIPSK